MTTQEVYIVQQSINCIKFFSAALSKNPVFIFRWAFFHYVILKFKKLLKEEIHFQCIPNKVYKNIAKKYCEELSNYVDHNSCILTNTKYKSNWYFLCSLTSRKKYQVYIVSVEGVPNNVVYVSDIIYFNIQNNLNKTTSVSTKYFLLPVRNKSIIYAKEAKVSLITNPYESSGELIKTLLENYFSVPRYVHVNDIFIINVKTYAPECFYTCQNPELANLYFKVNVIFDHLNNKRNYGLGSYIVQDKTTLIQEGIVYSYLPSQYFDDQVEDISQLNICNIQNHLNSNCPPALKEYAEQLRACIVPFLQKDFQVNVHPIFYVKGPQGCGKAKLVQSVAQSIGINLYNVNISEVHTLTTAQTEAKVRIMLQNAANVKPCILLIRNIQMFGINSEGKKDERAISSLVLELWKLYETALEYPVIVVATGDGTDISVDLERVFIDNISINGLTQDQRYELLVWLLKSKCLQHSADLHKIAGLCSDFVLADLESLILHAVKIDYTSKKDKEEIIIKLTQEHFIKAYEYMQTTFSDRFGTPRIPKVHWEDIGGLVDLKHEIIRRIELPLQNTSILGRSGLLLYGPPGTGKTLLAKAVATECQLHFLSVKGPELLNMYVGQSEKNVRQVFERARVAAPCIIFFDELDSLAPNRGFSGDSGGVMDRVVSQLLAEMDGLETSGNVFIIGATNRPDLIDPALLRPGRFDKMLYVGIYSDIESQISVLKALTRRFHMGSDCSEFYKKLVDKLPANLTGADMYSICCNAWLAAVRRKVNEHERRYNLDNRDDKSLTMNTLDSQVVVRLSDFNESITNFIPSVSTEEIKKYKQLNAQLSQRLKE